MPATKTDGNALQDQLIDTIETAQSMVLDGVGAITASVTNFKTADLPDPKTVWSRSFDFAEKVIDSQRKFGLALLDTVTAPVSKDSASA